MYGSKWYITQTEFLVYFNTLSVVFKINSTCTEFNTFDLRNASFVYLPYELILLNIIWPIISLMGLVGNTLFIWTVMKVSILHTSAFIALSSLACTDSLSLILVGFLICLKVAYQRPLAGTNLVLFRDVLLARNASFNSEISTNISSYQISCLERNKRNVSSNWCPGGIILRV